MAVVQSVLLFGSKTWVLNPRLEKALAGFHHWAAHGLQMSSGKGAGVPTHWSGAGNGGIGGYQVIYSPSPEHGCAINCNPSYHGFLFVGRADTSNVPIQAMVETA